MDTDQETHEIVRIIVMLAHNLGLKVVAEGVETQAQLDLLRDLGCERAQGYLFSKPVDHETILKLLEGGRPHAIAGRSKAVGSA
jgi:EAL domain-containing protein (putative c-di-GMP-specific phosphodiesterase class I)